MGERNQVVMSDNSMEFYLQIVGNLLKNYSSVEISAPLRKAYRAKELAKLCCAHHRLKELVPPWTATIHPRVFCPDPIKYPALHNKKVEFETAKLEMGEMRKTGDPRIFDKDKELENIQKEYLRMRRLANGEENFKVDATRTVDIIVIRLDKGGF